MSSTATAYRKGKQTCSFPFRMGGYNVQSAIVQGTVYVGGGVTDLLNRYIVMAYDTSLGKWAKLPPYTGHLTLQ